MVGWSAERTDWSTRFGPRGFLAESGLTGTKNSGVQILREEGLKILRF